MKTHTKVKHVILSGGVGSRLWPLSRKTKPKQYLDLFSGKSLFQLCVERNDFLNPKVIVVGNSENYQLSREILTKLGVEDYFEVIEAMPKNTAPAIAFAALMSEPDDILLVTPSDHLIENEVLYQKSVYKAIELAKNNKLVTFGIIPSRADTAYGYIEANGEDVVRFREKPAKELAEEFLANGNFLWNSGMFCFKASAFLEELNMYQSEMVDTVKNAIVSMKGGFLDKTSNSMIPSISVDYAVMEKSHNIAVVHSEFRWSDMGSFDALADHLAEKKELELDANGNFAIGCNRFISFVGVSNVILVETPDAILVLDKDSSQDVKLLFEKLDKEDSILLR
ncbi:mannose-1-phosphate guanylyltransferase [Algoriphagus antarcticus]|uniref:Mannose-1-phosphate guanylyltransferase n=1 Tax=Algoriphagus antarcticus TaxID=238540 RepID=A0A3E0DH50_9BACT|nr:sugar phosphate nucleotidyltransferase [Algoriphagus antarcticus]REG81407.1 mannose-1-phosphate guanylyltransferase [Algoriphagus antarcticus]